ncbi:sodium-coupled neutral amino acid transporter 5 isoform X1 [Antechinus flavipes]|uniref:sodium-coupled neutral amino acid transporter 5 isoform X1 n=1 Tax=Antechinus flavipes TaxID=38775 RepID=UPI002236597F|nr:sodium-coupled neutral amino acid transporter 5 isoform X1 [Antechinus flavipes]XP_051824283.1 sodium-coupled neutral amino acid transporter 5 isoform X1 [Antechinus flavipes]
MELMMGEPRMNGLVPRGPPEPEQSQAELAGFLPRPPLGKQAVQFSDFEGKTSLGMSMFNLSNAIMGSGILGLAYAMANTGVLLFLVLLLCMALLSAYSIHLLLTCAGFVGIRAYEELGRRAFGISGNVAVAGVICLHNIGAMSSYLYIIKSELPLVIETFLDSKTTDSSPWFLDGNVLIVLVSVGIVLPLALMRHLGYLGYTSGLSLTCMVFFLASVIYKKFSMECPLTSGNWTTRPAQVLNDTCEVHFFTINSQTAYTIPILAFAFVCHPEVLPIYTELRRSRGGRDATYVQSGPADPLRETGGAHGGHPHHPGRPLPDPPSYPAAPVPDQSLQLDPARHHCPWAARLGQCSGHIRARHPGHLWGHRSHLGPQPHLYPPQHFLHPNHPKGPRGLGISPQAPGHRLHGSGRRDHGHELGLHLHRLGSDRPEQGGGPLNQRPSWGSPTSATVRSNRPWLHTESVCVFGRRAGEGEGSWGSEQSACLPEEGPGWAGLSLPMGIKVPRRKGSSGLGSVGHPPWEGDQLGFTFEKMQRIKRIWGAWLSGNCV